MMLRANKRPYASLHTEHPSKTGDDVPLMQRSLQRHRDNADEQSPYLFIRQSAEQFAKPAEAMNLTSPLELASPMLADENFTTVSDSISMHDPISYDPMRHIDMNTATAPKRFFRTFWRGFVRRILLLSTGQPFFASKF